MKDKPTVFISYSHQSITYVNKLVGRIDDIARVYWDKSLAFFESFDHFMDTIGKHDYVVIVISDDYLKSKNCQYEAIQLMTVENWDKKTMFIVEENARRLYDAGGRIGYIDYWAKKEQELKNEKHKHDAAAEKIIEEEIQICIKIKEQIGEFLSRVAKYNNPEPKDAIEAVVERLKISAKMSNSDDIEKMIIKLIGIGFDTTKDLAVATDRSESNIRMHLRKLKEANTIKQAETGRRGQYTNA